jgi:hypothetical protein
MWWMPDRSSFNAEDHGVLTGIGKLNASRLSCIKTFTTTLLTRAKRDIFKDKTPLINQLSYTLQDLLHRLERISTNFRTMQLGVRSTQRVFLELTACLDYTEFYSPVINGELPPDSIPKIAKTIGTFTQDLTVCNRFHMAKIPVWLIRPSHTLRSLRIMAVAPVQYPGGLVALDPAIRPSYPAIFRGPHNLDMYRALAQHVLGYLRYPDPFGSVRARQNLSLPAPPPEPSKREIRAKRYTPCKLIFIFSIYSNNVLKMPIGRRILQHCQEVVASLRTRIAHFFPQLYRRGGRRSRMSTWMKRGLCMPNSLPLTSAMCFPNQPVSCPSNRPIDKGLFSIPG